MLGILALLFVLFGIVVIAAIVRIIIKRAIKRQREQDAAMNAAPGDTWPCPICREQIPKGAKKCVKCQSELRWRRYLIFGSTTLALITALISVIALSAPTIKSIFETKDSDIDGVYISAVFSPASGGSANGRLSLLVNNRGVRMGAVRGGILSVFWEPSRVSAKSLELQLTTPDRLPLFIAARDTKPVIMDIGSDFQFDVADEDKKDCVTRLKSLPPVSDFEAHENKNIYCFIELDVANASGKYGGTHYGHSIEAPCQDLVPSILGAIERSRLKVK